LKKAIFSAVQNSRAGHWKMSIADAFWRWLARKLLSHSPAMSHQHPLQAKVSVSVDLKQLRFGLSANPAPEAKTTVTTDDVRKLMGKALSTPTPDAIFSFLKFTHQMRRMGPYNILMVYTQRPGAVAVASRKDWAEVGQQVLPDAIPILILQPRGPIAQVFELLDTLPAQARDPRVDPFGATGDLDVKRLQSVIAGFRQGKRKLRVDILEEDYGAGLAGRITTSGLLNPSMSVAAMLGNEKTEDAISCQDPARWRIKLNSRMTPAEKFATLMHELGHLFCGHLGAFVGETPEADEYGWPDRRELPHATREIEAELVAWHMCDREGLLTGAPLYLKPYLEKAERDGDLAKVDLDRVIRAIARIRQHAGERKPPVVQKP